MGAVASLRCFRPRRNGGRKLSTKPKATSLSLMLLMSVDTAGVITLGGITRSGGGRLQNN